METVQPLLDKVLVKVEKTNEAKRNGIILPETSKNQPTVGVVVARGPGGMLDGKEIKMYVNQGDKVLLNKFAGTEITLNGQKHLIVKQSDILGMIC